MAAFSRYIYFGCSQIDLNPDYQQQGWPAFSSMFAPFSGTGIY